MSIEELINLTPPIIRSMPEEQEISLIEKFVDDLKAKLLARRLVDNYLSPDDIAIMIRQINHLMKTDPLSTSVHELDELDEPNKLDELDKCLSECKIDTINCCQNDRLEGYVLINFSTLSDFDKFYEIVFDEIDMNNDKERKIFYRARIFDESIAQAWIRKIYFSGENRQMMSAQVNLPIEDYGFVRGQLERWVDENKENYPY